mmetsp:Transcript_13853/g.11825  ORF Transcript_13853/g.11825 Transcript_13853/m.11825 type:complete len:390 (-) Transcript_13853:168-1337(-)
MMSAISTAPAQFSYSSWFSFLAPNSFAVFSASFAHLTTDVPNVITISATLGGTGITTPTGYVELPGFPATLGGSYADGSSIPCYSAAATSIECILEAGNNYVNPRLRLENIPTLAAAANFDLKIFRVDSPSRAGKGSIILRLMEIYRGNKKDGVYAGSFVDDFVAGPPAANAVALAIAADEVQDNTNNYNLGDASITTAAGDTVVYYFPLDNYGSLAAPTCAGCTFYADGGVLEVTVASVGVAYALTANNMPNPPALPASDTTIGYYISGGQVTNIITFTPSTPYVRGTFLNVAMTPLETNTGTKPNTYLVEFEPVNVVESGGMIRLSFPVASFAANPVAYGFEMLSGTYTGTPRMKSSISAPNFYIDIYDFTQFDVGMASFLINIDQG